MKPKNKPLPKSVVKALDDWNKMNSPNSHNDDSDRQHIKVFVVDSADMLEPRFDEWILDKHTHGYMVVINSVNVSSHQRTVMVVLYHKYPLLTNISNRPKSKPPTPPQLLKKKRK